MQPDLLNQIRNALADPQAPWYGSDLVPWVADLLDAYDRAIQTLGVIDAGTMFAQDLARRALRDITGASE